MIDYWSITTSLRNNACARKVIILKCTNQWFLAYSQGWIVITTAWFCIFITPKRNPYLFSITPFSPPSCPWQWPNYFLSLWICLLCTFHINSHTICGLLCLDFSLKCYVPKVHLRCSTYQYFMHFYCCVILHWMDILTFLYGFLSWRACGLFAYFDFICKEHKERCPECSNIHFLLVQTLKVSQNWELRAFSVVS